MRLTKSRFLHQSLNDHGQQALIMPVLLRQAQPGVTLAATSSRLLGFRGLHFMHMRDSTNLAREHFSLCLLPFEPGAVQVFVPQSTWTCRSFRPFRSFVASDVRTSHDSHDCTSNF